MGRRWVSMVIQVTFPCLPARPPLSFAPPPLPPAAAVSSGPTPRSRCPPPGSSHHRLPRGRLRSCPRTCLSGNRWMRGSVQRKKRTSLCTTPTLHLPSQPSLSPISLTAPSPGPVRLLLLPCNGKRVLPKLRLSVRKHTVIAKRTEALTGWGGSRESVRRPLHKELVYSSHAPLCVQVMS